MPRINQVAVVDAATWKVVANVDTGLKPTRLALQPDEKYLWVANETGAGNQDIEFGTDNKFAFVTNRTDGTLSLINVPKLRKLKDVKTGGMASALAFSPLITKALSVGNETDGSIAVVDAASHKLLANIVTKPGLKTVRFARDGRWGFVANPAESKVFIFDASTNSLIHEQAVGEAPDGFAFTDNFAYVRSLGTPKQNGRLAL